MKSFFEPESAVLIGASANPYRPGHQLFQNMNISCGDRFYPVNPRVDEIEGKKCYQSVLDIPEAADVAVIFISAAGVPDAMEDCATRGIKRVIIESGGFAETGLEGEKLQERCAATARASGMRLWGPNCMGTINVHRTKVLSFLMTRMWKDSFIPGRVSLVVQSGMLSAGFLLHILSRTPFGLSKIASIGNKADVDEVDVLEYLVDDPETGVIGLYLESIRRGRRFFELCKNTTKPVVVLKGGRTSQGHSAAGSHTAALAQDDAVLDAAFRQAGIVRAYGMTELMDLARCLEMGEVPPTDRVRVAVLTFSGGAGVVTSDDLHDYGMELAELSPHTTARIKKVFPDWMDPANPVDLYPAIEKNGPQNTMKESLEAVMEDPAVDAAYIHIFAPPVDRPIFDYDKLCEKLKSYQKPVVVWIMGHAEASRKIQAEMESRGIPVAEEIQRGVRMLSAMTRRR
ncbi:MAG: CoA-binding protein [bacterium]